ncbi:hypothetical protein L6164_002829 [Bauhinia variegata]|uniref:Uncharacterized protein n=2 Tax=Bauhinia variegata TaxID=167791 RepID=A0ACB9PZ80_BAUVA|nr:hypothetical protein L6164_002809 [Bauhinia variegata]KAI4353909.1 hypothetical protein L6164_002829 [Bauhinia variegata]
MVMDFLNNNSPWDDINHTHIVLILQVKNPKDTTQFRSISLCNVAAKRLPNRLKVIWPSILSINQSDFISSCQITDNVLPEYELLHALKTKNFGKEGYLALKHDMSKAYDRMEWEFLWAMMAKLGFVGRWIDLIMSYVSLVSYSILIKSSRAVNPREEVETRRPIISIFIPNFCRWF